MKRAFLFHGAYGNPDENWFPWLKADLEKQGYLVVAPRLPTPEGQTLSNWLAAFKAQYRLEGEDTLIGHSIGAAFALRLIERAKKPVRACYLVSGFASRLGKAEFDGLNRTFIEKGFDYEKIRANCPLISIFHSDNDPYVPLLKAEELAFGLKTRLTVVPGAGHFNEKSGYLRFPLLSRKIRSDGARKHNGFKTKPIK